MPPTSNPKHLEFCRDLARQLEGSDSIPGRVPIADFLRVYWTDYTIEEIEREKGAGALEAARTITLDWWRSIQVFDPGAPMVSVENRPASNGTPARTLIRVHQRRMPFLMDSLRVALNRRDLRIHTLQEAQLRTQRNEAGRLEAFAGAGGDPAASLADETLIHLEIAHCAAEGLRREIAEEIRETLIDIELAVGDFDAMRARLGSVVDQLEKAPPISLAGEEIEEAREFLAWLSRHHFTFLGSVEVEFQERDGRLWLREVPESRLGVLRKAGRHRDPTPVASLPPMVEAAMLTPALVGFSKSSVRSSVHRDAYGDYVTIKRFDADGEVCGELRFLGLYASPVFSESPFTIPIVRRKLDYVMARAAEVRSSFQSRYLENVLQYYPREELFEASARELCQTALGIMHMQERKRVRLFTRLDVHGRFFNCLVYFPRDRYNTDLRRATQEILAEAFGAEEVNFTTFFSESVLCRTHYVLRVDPSASPSYDLAALEARIIEVAKTWDDRLEEALVAQLGAEAAARIFDRYEGAFGAGYRADCEPAVAIADIAEIDRVLDRGGFAVRSSARGASGDSRFACRIFRRGEMLVLSDVIPIFENLGLRVTSEHLYQVSPRTAAAGDREVWIQAFELEYVFADHLAFADVLENFHQAFEAILTQAADNDSFNALILGTQLDWRGVSVLRAYAKYMKQIGFGFSLRYVADTLSRNRKIAEDLVALFAAQFDPDLAEERRGPRAEALMKRIESALEQVASLDDDRIVRQISKLIRASLRTNFYQRDSGGGFKEYLSIKLDPQQIPEMPQPRPRFEIFVHSPRVEGVHLRGGLVARGGLRWSDRLQDYRTEILGLVKAQQVKNAVIVPVGAKGGFVAKRARVEGPREEYQAEGIACYQTFIRGLLDVTDNYTDGRVVPPPRVVRRDGDDPYLVVAADKGTATFSDVANTLSKQYGFWLGDAFASGGSVGFDHKAMGITARGAWVAVQRHFRHLGVDIQTEDFTVVGIGDMGGDVFGNGMLLSQHIRLVAAFNHSHIFVDPDPDAARSYEERRRLFASGASNWSEYDPSAISGGGGVFSRAAKSIAVSPEMRRILAIEDEHLTPSALISAILRAPVDLLWNGGIGTYVKARCESHAEVGDKANDGLRVDAESLRCRVVGEGGNLGFTQLGRVAFCLQGGAANTDFIDNAAGVDCSDHEVNVKILIEEACRAGEMSEAQRRHFLESMTESVAEEVLGNAYRQSLAISLAEDEAAKRMGEYRRYLSALESAGRLDRELEFLPSDDTLAERMTQGRALTRPEIAILVSYTKAGLKEELAHSDIAEDASISLAVESAFPREIRERFGARLQSHQLRSQIVATQIANDIVNRVGFTFVDRLASSTGSTVTEVVRAYWAAREIFGLGAVWAQMEELDSAIDVETQMWMMAELKRLARRGARWFLRNRRGGLDVAAEIRHFGPAVEAVGGHLPSALRGEMKSEWRRRRSRVLAGGGPEELADFIAGAPTRHICLGLVEVADASGSAPGDVAEAYFSLAERLDLHWLAEHIVRLRVDNYWQALARESALDDLDWQQRSLTASILASRVVDEPIHGSIERWIRSYADFAERWSGMLIELHGSNAPDFSMCSVALRELLDWAQLASREFRT